MKLPSTSNELTVAVLATNPNTVGRQKSRKYGIELNLLFNSCHSIRNSYRDAMD